MGSFAKMRLPSELYLLLVFCITIQKIKAQNSSDKKHILIYTPYSEDKTAPIYVHQISDSNQETAINSFKFDRPYVARCPYLVFNKDYNALEIIGDSNDNLDKIQHYHLNLDKIQTELQSRIQLKNQSQKSRLYIEFDYFFDSLYKRDKYAEILYNDAVGTVLICGRKRRRQVYIVTQKQNWQKMTRGKNHLPSLPTDKRSDRSVNGVSFRNKIIVAGGYGREGKSDKVRIINFDGIISLTGANTRKWKVLGTLKNPIHATSINIVDNELWIEGLTDKLEDKFDKKRKIQKQHPLHICNIYSSVCVEHKNFIQSSSRIGLSKPISYQNAGNLYYIGGLYSLDYCRQQKIQFSSRLRRPKTTCASSSDEEFEDITNEEYHFVNIFA